MSTSFSANQYQDAFISKKLGNWENPSSHRERPRPLDGYTQIVANDRGHLLEGVAKSKNNPWGNFVGTWDIPKKIPGNCATVKTARTGHAQNTLKHEAEAANRVLQGSSKNESRLNLKAGPRKQKASAKIDPAFQDSEDKEHARYNKTPVPAPEYLKNLTPVNPSPDPVLMPRDKLPNAERDQEPDKPEKPAQDAKVEDYKEQSYP